MPNFDPVEIEAGLQALAGVDFGNALASFQSANLQGELVTAEQILDVIAIFVPGAADAKAALVILGLIVKGYQDGLIHSAQPEDAVMQQAARPDKHGGR